MEDVKVLRGLVHPTSPDGRYSCPWPLPSHQREEPSRWFLRRTRPEHVEESAAEVDDPASLTGQTEAVHGPAGDGPADDDPASDSPADDGPTDDVSAGDGSARGSVMVTDDEPEIVDDPEDIADPAHSQQSAGDGPALDDDDTAGVAGPAHHQNPAVDGPAVVDGPVDHGTPAGNTPAAGQDSSMLADVSSLLFPSLPRADYFDWLHVHVDFDAASDGPGYGCSLCPVTARCTVNRSYAQRRSHHPGGLRLHLGRQTDDPECQWDGPGHLRRARGMDDTRESTRSRSPIRRSSSWESPSRDASPVNFSAALDSEDKAKDKSMTDDEDEDGAQKKVSAAQYQLFRQAVLTSKGSFNVNPAKSRRASRASLLDLSDSEVTDQVSWLDQPSLKDTMASIACIAQGLKEEEEVKKTTLSETLNTSSSTFKHLTVKQIFPREPYRLKIRRDAQYVPKPPGDSGFSDSKPPLSYQMSHRMCLDTEELSRGSAIYASFADSMVASVIEELSPKVERTKLLREKLAIIQEAQVSAVSAGFAAASNLQLLRRDALLKNFGFQPQVLSTVRTAPYEGSHVLGPEPKVLQNRVRTIRQADRMAGSSVTFPQKHRESKSSTKATSSRKTASRTSDFDRLGSPTATTTQRTVTQEPPFCAGAGRGARHRPYSDSRKKPGKSSAASSTRQRWRVPDFAPRWRGLLGNYRATGIVEDGVGIVFQQRPQLTHQCISFRTRNSHQDLQQAVDALLLKGAIERVTNVASLGYYSRLFLVPKKTGDLRPVIDLSTLNRHMVVPHFKMETQGSVRSAIRSQEWTVSIDIRDAYLHVPMHQAVCKYLRFVVNKKVYQFTCLPFGLATSPREFTKLLRPVVALLRQQGVKLQSTWTTGWSEPILRNRPNCTPR